MRIHQQADDEEQRPVRLSFCRSLQRDPQLKCLTLSLLIVLSLASVAWCRIAPKPPSSSSRSLAGSSVGQCQHSGYVYFPVGLFCILYLVYLGECWHSSTHVSFRFPVDASAIYQQIRAMRLSPPIVWWRAVCYHYDRRLRQVMRYRRGDAYTSSQVFYERVNSQVTTTVFDYTHFGVIDASKRLVHLEKHPATKIRFSRKFSFACPLAEESYNQQRNEFLDEHQRMDDYLEFTDGLDLLNVRFDDQTVALSNPYHRPWYLYTWVFWVASVALLSYPLRLIIGFKTAHVHYQVHKIFGANRGPEFMTRILVGGDDAAGGHLVNGGQGVNGGLLETAIRHNLSLAPSYAEALQLSQHRPRFFLDRNFHSYGSIPLLPLADRKSSTASRILSDGLSSNVTGNHVTGLPVDDVRCFERSRVTRCVISVAREQNGATQTTTHRMANRVDVATVVNQEQERRDATVAVATTTFATVIGGSDEIRPGVMSECGNDEADVRKRRGNDRTVAGGQQSDENPDERRPNIAEAEVDCTTRTETFQEMTAQEVLTQPEIDQHPVDEEEEEEGDESLGIHRIDEYSLPREAHRLNRADGELFESPPSVSHLNFHSANPENESLDSSSSSNYLNCRHVVNQTGETRRPLLHHHHHHLNHLHRCVLHPVCESSLDVAVSANDANPGDSEDIDLFDLDLVNESPPSYEDALRMRRFVLPVTIGSGQHFQSQATSVDEFDEDSIGSPGHLSQDYAQADSGDNPSRSRAAVVIQIMETSL